MSQRIFTALGTGSQVPTRCRNHNGYFLQWDGMGMLFDPGEGTQRQMVYAGVSATKIHKIFITHFHGDHCLGLPGILQRISLDRVKHDVEVYYPASGQKYFDRMRYASQYYEAANIIPCPIEDGLSGPIWQNAELTISSIPLDHTVDCRGYRFTESDKTTMDPHKLKASGVVGPAIRELKANGSVLVGQQLVQLQDVSEQVTGQSFAFVMDTRFCINAIELAKDVTMLVIESTFLDSEQADATAHGHLTARDAGRIAAEASVKQLVLTHFSQRYTDMKYFSQQASEEYGGDISVMRDGDQVTISK